MSDRICDWCCQRDAQLVQVDQEWDFWMCPRCMAPTIPTDLCDRCREPVVCDPDRGDVILYAPPSFYDDATSFRHGGCRGRFDCDDCGEQIDLTTEEYELVYRLPNRIVVEIKHKRCPSFAAWAEAHKDSAA